MTWDRPVIDPTGHRVALENWRVLDGVDRVHVYWVVWDGRWTDHLYLLCGFSARCGDGHSDVFHVDSVHFGRVFFPKGSGFIWDRIDVFIFYLAICFGHNFYCHFRERKQRKILVINLEGIWSKSTNERKNQLKMIDPLGSLYSYFFSHNSH